MKHILSAAALCLLANAALAQIETRTVTTKDGETGTLEILLDDPQKAPNLYIGVLGFVDIPFSAREMSTGLGADMQYTYNEILGVNFSYMRGLMKKNTSEELSFINYSGINGGLTYYFRSDEEKTETMVHLKTESRGRTNVHHVVYLPCKKQDMMGVTVGFSSYNLPIEKSISSDDYHDLRLAATGAKMLSVGIKKTAVYMLEVDSKEFGSKNYKPRSSWYADVLFSPTPAATFYHRPTDSSGAVIGGLVELPDHQHDFKVIKAGLRLGHERTAVLAKKANGIGTLYRFELGYRPGIKSYGGGLYVNAAYVVNFGAKIGD